MWPALRSTRDNRGQALASQLPIIGVAQLKPQPTVPHSLAAADLAAQFRNVSGFRSSNIPRWRRAPRFDSPGSANRSRYIRTAELLLTLPRC
jgi:hypothetical protein